MQLDPTLIRRAVSEALEEDRAAEDVTTRGLVPPEQQGRAVLLAKEEGVLAGLPLAEEAFRAVNLQLRWQALKADGSPVAPGDEIATVDGSLASILRAERVSLNFVCHLSGVATAANRVARLLHGTNCRLRDTRKTIPGLRTLQKYAAAMGGATNHRLDLADGILVKDNHLAALQAREMTMEQAVATLRKTAPGMRIEIEVDTLEQARLAAKAGADELLLDNMTPDQVRGVVEALAAAGTRPILEASGGITEENARAYAEAGVDYVSIGAVTHSAPALDVSLEVEVS
jgi:nicotinate-nucleotide pyrophosphorylase (carboxylating)